MSNTQIKLRRSAVPGKIPTTEQIDLGEIAINTYDGKIFIKKNDGTESIVTIEPVAGSDGQLVYNNGGISGGANVFYNDTTDRVGVGTSSPSAKLDVAGDIEVNSNVNLNSEATTLATTTKTQVASFAVASFRSGKLIVQAYDTFTNEVQVSELLVAHNGTTTSATEYGVVFTGANPLVVYDVDISSGNVRLLAQRTTPNPTQYTVSETLLSAFDPAFGAFSWDSNTASPGPA